VAEKAIAEKTLSADYSPTDAGVPDSADRQAKPANGHRQHGSPGGKGSDGHRATNGDKGNRVLEIQFRSCGDVERDKYRLRQIYESVRDPKGRDQFVIVLQAGDNLRKLAFPQDPCSITDRLVDELGKYFRVEARIT
jgi:hypothetical protein